MTDYRGTMVTTACVDPAVIGAKVPSAFCVISSRTGDHQAAGFENAINRPLRRRAKSV
jgi:hypothetical protein